MLRVLVFLLMKLLEIFWGAMIIAVYTFPLYFTSWLLYRYLGLDSDDAAAIPLLVSLGLFALVLIGGVLWDLWLKPNWEEAGRMLKR